MPLVPSKKKSSCTGRCHRIVIKSHLYSLDPSLAIDSQLDTTVDFVPRRPRLTDCASASSHCTWLASYSLMPYSLVCQIFRLCCFAAKFSVLSENSSSIWTSCLLGRLRFSYVLASTLFESCDSLVRRMPLARVPKASRLRTLRRKA